MERIALVPCHALFEWSHTECVTDLDYQSKMIIFKLILTTFELSSFFGGSLGNIDNWLVPRASYSHICGFCDLIQTSQK
jgi:hypothetical protein